MLTQEENPGIEFEYSIQEGSVKETSEGGDHYDWLLGEWSECPDECGEVQRMRTVVCSNVATREIVPDHLCGGGSNKPEETEDCPPVPCKPQWATGPWSNCTALGNDGQDGGSGDKESDADGSGDSVGEGECPAFKVRNVYCAEGKDMIDENDCTALGDDGNPVAGERPEAVEPCEDEMSGDGADDDPQVRTS